MPQTLPRCDWVNTANPLYVTYHDTEWGVPVHDDRLHFEMLTLEGAQAGLSWETILKRREGYRAAFLGFDPVAVAAMTDAQLDALMHDSSIIRHRQKILSVRGNARIFLTIQQEFGSFDAYIWRFMEGTHPSSPPRSLADIPTRTNISDRIAKDLKKRGMKFVGSTILYAYMQAIGMVNDHMTHCFRTPQG